MVDALVGLAAQPADTESAPVPEPSQFVFGSPGGTVDASSAPSSAPGGATRRLFRVVDQGLRGQPRSLLHLFDGPLCSLSPIAHTGLLSCRASGA
jgi:hypothetical protein